MEGDASRRPGIVLLPGGSFAYDGYEPYREARRVAELHTPALRPESTW